MNAGAVRVRGRHRQFGTTRALDRADLDITPGEFVALICKSGSGETTLVAIIKA